MTDCSERKKVNLKLFQGRGYPWLYGKRTFLSDTKTMTTLEGQSRSQSASRPYYMPMICPNATSAAIRMDATQLPTATPTALLEVSVSAMHAYVMTLSSVHRSNSFVGGKIRKLELSSDYGTAIMCHSVGILLCNCIPCWDLKIYLQCTLIRSNLNLATLFF